MILNVYVPNNEASKYVRSKLIELQGEIDDPTVTAGNLQSSVKNGQMLNLAGRSVRMQLNSTTLSNNRL